MKISKTVWRWFWIALGVRVFATILIHLYSLSLGYGGFYPLASGADDGTYWHISNTLYAGLPAPYTESYYGHILYFYFRLIGGPDLLLGKLLNALAGAFTVAIGVRLCEELGRGRASKQLQKRAAGWAGALLCFYPSLLWYSTQLVKDPMLVMLGMGALLYLVRMFKSVSPASVVGWALCVAGLFLFRPYASLAIFFSLFVWVMRFNRRLILPSIVLIAVLPWLAGRGLFGIQYIAPLLDAERIMTMRQDIYSAGGSSAGITLNYSNPVAFAATYSYSFATAMFGPFPWQIRAMGQAVALPEAVVIWTLFPIWWAGARSSLRRAERGPLTRAERQASRDLLLMILCLVLCGMIAIFSDNIGANTRLRLLPWSAFLVFASLRLACKRWKF